MNKSECQSHADIQKLLMECSSNDERHQTTLDFHSKTLDEILELLKDHGKQINETNRIVTNGMQLNIKDIKDSIKLMSGDLQGFMTETREKIAIFDEFSWFRKTVNAIRDYSIWIIIVGILYILASHLDAILPILSKLK